MNGRLAALFGALQGGTRRKPTYLNTGALVSWVYAVKTKDAFGIATAINDINIADTTFQGMYADSIVLAANVGSLFFEDVVKIQKVNDIFAINAGVSSLVFTDTVKIAQGSQLNEKLVINTEVTNISFTDNVKVPGTLSERLVLTASVNSMILEDV